MIIMDETTLEQCPIGLFLDCDDNLCLKTEYGNNEGRIDAFLVTSGEFFWGTAPQTIANQRKQLVRPVNLDNLLWVTRSASIDAEDFEARLSVTKSIAERRMMVAARDAAIRAEERKRASEIVNAARFTSYDLRSLASEIEP